ncbi:hypothetical protein HVV52_18225 [Escherichia fergusonii]|uniref:hypothetical protein n=1 Tax=Escherichia fergusonii TaxID=564 RepID=UPI0015E565D7|nr:hypothetical protein [Escherichia fergusonii]QLM09559.1 hypothetical protein HVV50_18220 [Escherichia fergusonii]QLM14151.1 hypothetical protein HVV51_18230 [Escherichia fergusonii]QLM18746.1 hypothetical protein HVV52_18225 [Escherichia fergusonii]QMQ72052.1 hypothetical protein HVV54_18225 [Escherichia fergusonii]WFU98590.1 hypothetical protein NFJ18_18270 [Escherichia fergusonii]
MMRCHYLPSDFHPLLLIVCEREELTLLSALLTTFAKDEISLAINEQSFVEYCSSPLIIEKVAIGDGVGITKPDYSTQPLHWKLEKHIAAEYSATLEELAGQGTLSGSCFLEIGYIDEVRVKVTFGEFDDSWLLTRSNNEHRDHRCRAGSGNVSL